MLYLYIFGSITFAIALIFTWRKLYLWRTQVVKARAEAEKSRRIGIEADELLARAEEGNAKAQDDLVDRGFSSTNPTRKARLKANEKRVKARRRRRGESANWRWYGKPVKQAYEAWQKALGTGKEPYLCAAFVLVYKDGDERLGLKTRKRLLNEIGLTLEEAQSRLQAVVHEHYERLSTQLENEKSFRELRQLILQSQEKTSDLRKAGVDPLLYPEGWNDAVAKFVRNPNVHDFDWSKSPQPGEVLQWGEDALQENDIVKVKLILAYAAQDPHWRKEIGGYLNHLLGEFEASHHASLTAKAATPVEPSV